ncbi:MAG TPA: M55 family metallopeptidase [Candidatus Eremiobacteraceae bacterium]|nr:M55 family metallopeptidase [Candidatus Eremiobacteraceae bacterium]
MASAKSARGPSIFASVDLEGCATLVHWDEVRPSADAAYQRSRRLMTSEVDAALRGAFAAGASNAFVNDSHSVMRNLLLDELDPRVKVVSGRLKPQFMLQGIEGCDAAFFIGYHGAIGDANAVMGHTYSPRIIFECRFNGEPVGETTINAALAGHFGVPVALVSADRTTLEEVRRNLPWAVTVETKESIGYYSADGLSPAVVRELLEEAGALAVKRLPEMRTFSLASPTKMEIDTIRTSQADMLELVPGMTRTASRTVAFSADNFAEIYRALMAVIYLGAAA